MAREAPAEGISAPELWFTCRLIVRTASVNKIFVLGVMGTAFSEDQMRYFAVTSGSSDVCPGQTPSSASLHFGFPATDH